MKMIRYHSNCQLALIFILQDDTRCHNVIVNKPTLNKLIVNKLIDKPIYNKQTNNTET